jgi:LETM1 and EF-hand domain-containing protein 1
MFKAKRIFDGRKRAFHVTPKLSLNTEKSTQIKPVAPIPQKKLVQRIKEEALHYWHGLKLLGTETSISSRLLLKLLKGNELSRREYRQVSR